MDTLIRSGLQAYFTSDDLSITHLEAACERETQAGDYPLSLDIEKNIVIYSAERLASVLEHEEQEQSLKAELALCLRDGPGVLVIKGAFSDTGPVDASSELFRQIVADEKQQGSGQGDHFGRNERIWNAAQKVCERSPAIFLDYYSNPWLALVCESWLGPGYQITAQMNTVKPGSKAQDPHRDYHLGFQSRQTIEHFPVHAQIMSQFLTLQGAVAHSDMPLEMGPTMFLPHSQKVPAGYLSFSGHDAQAYFEHNHVQLPLHKGDMVFFNPALMHGAGCNQTQQDRIANLLQISSAFGRPMETVNRLKMIKAAYGELLRRHMAGMSNRTLQHAISALADGYSFPTNLDSDPPVGGNAPETVQQILLRAIKGQATLESLMQELQALAQRQSA